MYGSVLRVFARGTDYARWQSHFSGGAWTWQYLNGVINGAPSAVVDGTFLRVFVRAANHTLWQSYSSGGTWTWQDLGRVIT